MRYLARVLSRDLRKKVVLLAGPRQCGKTTLAKSLLDGTGEYLNWDIQRDRKIIRELAWPKDASMVVLDELHKAPKWKNLLKGVIDEFGNKPPLLVTGSARLDAFRRAGRQRSYRDKIMVTTLAPCWYCSGLVRQFNIGTVIVGESVNFAGGIDWLRENGVNVIDLDNAECRELLEAFIQKHPEVWNEDIGEE